MSVYRFILITASLFYINHIQAQADEQNNRIGISLGYNSGLYKNLILSPIKLYEYNNPIYELDYRRKTKKDRLLTLRLKHWNSELKSDKTPQLNLNYANTSLRFDYQFPVVQKPKLSVYTGFFSQIIQVAQKSDETYIAAEIRKKMAWSGRLNYQLNDKHAISSQLSIPVFVFLYGNLDTDLYSFKRYQGYTYSLSYHYQLSTHFDINLRYFSNYDRIQSNNVFRELQNQMTLGIHYNF